MKKKSPIYILLLIYSFVSLSVMGKDIAICVAHDHIGFKLSESKCCYEDNNREFSINNSSNECLECHNFPLLLSNDSKDHIIPKTNVLDYSYLRQVAPFNHDPFVKIRNSLKNQLRVSSISKHDITGQKPLLLALCTVPLLL